MPPDTQTDCSLVARLLRSPLVLALLVTFANAAKPVLVDDTAYLAYARHIAQHPFDPYGFTIFWYAAPEPAFEVLAPPVVPYWLAIGTRLFGEHIALVKLSLFPFLWLFAWAVRELLWRFARSAAILPLIVLSPAVLPSVNLMLDVPALALGLVAIASFARAADRGSWRLAIGAGLIAALAMQTKYTMLLVPPVIVWYGITHRKLGLAGVAFAIAIASFAAWELLMLQAYGQSHFLFHASTQQSGEPGLANFARAKFELAPSLAAHLGCLGIGAGLVAAGAMGVRSRWLRIVAAVWALAFLLIATVPDRWTVIVSGEATDTTDTTAAMVFWQIAGFLILLVLTASAAVLVLRFRRGLSVRFNADSLFLAGWFAVELAGYFALTPFPAARRVMGVAVVGALLAARAASRLGRLHVDRRPPRWVLAFGIAVGVAVAAIDFLDAFPEKVCAERTAAIPVDRPVGSTVWFAGHWGFQYYCERAGMRPLVPGKSVLRPGDFLVLPVVPDGRRFYRPHTGGAPNHPSVRFAEPVAEVKWDDPLSAQTVPNYYGGREPVVGRDHPRLRVAVYRITRECIAGEW